MSAILKFSTFVVLLSGAAGAYYYGLLDSQVPPPSSSQTTVLAMAPEGPATDQNRAVSAAAGPFVEDICKGDEDRLAELRARPSPEEAMRFSKELHCERLRPQVEALIAGSAVADAGAVGGALETKSAEEKTASASSPVALSLADEVCRREEARLERLQTNPSTVAIAEFLLASHCDRLLPQIRALIDSMRPPKPKPTVRAAADPPLHVASASEADHPAPSAWTDIAPAPSLDATAPATDGSTEGDRPEASAGDAAAAKEACRRDEQRLVELRRDPSREKIAQFADEMRCEELRPQLSRVADSVGESTAPLLASGTRSANQGLAEGAAVTSACTSDQDTLNRVRKQPSPGAVQELWRNLRCERLRPQVRRVLECLDLTADLSDACRHEAEELKRIRSNPNRREAEDFARGVLCDVLKPQAARLLESLSE